MTKRNNKNRLRSPVAVAAIKEWDATLAVGDLVSCNKDYPAVHVYKIVKSAPRQLYPEDMFNYPSLKKNKKKSGDAYAPLLTLRLYRPAPTWKIIGPPSKEKVVDGFLVTRVSPEAVESIIRSLHDLLRDVRNISD